VPFTVNALARRVARPDTSVGAGILLSRLAGLLRVRLIAREFGQNSIAVDAFNAAFRIPNLLQSLFGEGALSGSFIPVHSALRARGDHEAAAQTARAFFALLALAIAVLVLLGVLGAPFLVELVAPGFDGAKRALTVRLVRILFPGAGILVASAWCLGVLNSHGRFLLAYTAPVAWNAAMIGTLVAFGGRHDLDTLAIYLAWGSVVGSLLQFGVQARQAWLLTQHDLEFGVTPHVRQVVRNFMPVLVSRGAVQLTGYIDTMIASLLPTGAVTALTNAQILYTLPVSLFGIAISASELPAMSGDAAVDSAPGRRYDALSRRIDAALKRMAFFVIPSAVAFAALGDVIAGVLLQTGRFTAADSRYVWGILAGSSIGLLASTMARLYSVAHYAIGDTKAPLRLASIRLVAVAALGYLCAIVLPRLLRIPAHWGAAGLTASAGVAGWMEFMMLRASLNRRVGATGLRRAHAARLWMAALLAAAAAFVVRRLLPPTHPILAGVLVLTVFGLVYFGTAALAGIALPVFGRMDRPRSRSAGL
jgi:putative peptidoglycan lipid II flippase